jgi:hypothetical protein
MDNSVWGPPLWKELHDELYQYADNPTEAQKFEINSTIRCKLFDKIKCFDCLIHAMYYFTSSMSTGMFDSKSKICIWGFKFHNWVNTKLGKPIYTINEFLELYPIKITDMEFLHRTS